MTTPGTTCPHSPHAEDAPCAFLVCVLADTTPLTETTMPTTETRKAATATRRPSYSEARAAIFAHARTVAAAWAPGLRPEAHDVTAVTAFTALFGLNLGSMGWSPRTMRRLEGAAADGHAAGLRQNGSYNAADYFSRRIA